MNKPKLFASATALALTIALAGCGSGGDGPVTSSSASPAASATSAGPARAAPATGPHDDADLMFVQMMIPHHRQAVEMADMIVGKQGIDSDVTRLASQIRAAQSLEIDQMTGWSTEWGQGATPMGMDHAMGGTMSEQDMDALDKATGDQAAKLFLTGMISHHQGAIDMARDELANGQSPAAKELAQSIADSQQSEIATMKGLLSRY